MEQKRYEQLNETLYTETLDNGLKVILLPKNDFHKTFAMFGTEFGSIDQHFVPLGKNDPVRVPDGIAHFLEHKLFEKEDGDVFHTFSKYGASANAFTSFTKTAYLFSTTNFVHENLKTLLDFVQDPYFTEETVNKEKGIIEQEIQMYDDMPDWRLMFGLLQNLYPEHPVRIDIAGTVNSIQDITADLLYENYYTFYHPNNMTLFVVGQIDVDDMMELIRGNQNAKDFAPPEEIKRLFPNEDLSEIVHESTLEMDVKKPKVSIGIRGVDNYYQGREALRYTLGMQIAMKLLFGTTSSNYLNLYDSGLIDESFSIDFSYERTFNFLNVSSDTKKPEEFIQSIKQTLKTGSDSLDFNEIHFETIKKRSIGQALKSLNSLEFIAHQFIDQTFGEATIFDIVPVLEDITLEEVKQLADDYLNEDYLSVYKILPKG